MKQAFTLLLALLFTFPSACAATFDPLTAYHVRSELGHLPATSVDVYRLWLSLGKDEPNSPRLTGMRPHPGRANGAAVVGGAYLGLAGMLEGVEPAA